MSSPDAAVFTGLTIYDRNPRDLVDVALADAVTKLPGWVPQEGNTEVTLIEALALLVAEMVYAINRLPAEVTLVLLQLFGVTRSDGVAPTSTVTFTLSDTLGHTIPAGTTIRVDPGGSADPVTFTTDADLVIGSGDDEGTVAVTGTVATTDANGLPAGTPATITSALFFTESAEFATDIGGGVAPESDEAWLDRGVQRFARLSDTLVVPARFTAAALEDDRVLRAYTLDNHNGVTSEVGHVAVAVAAAGGVALSAPIKAELEATFEAQSAAMLDVHVIDPTVTTVNVTATVHRLAGFTDAEVEANVEAALTAYLNPDTWEWGATVRRNDLIALIESTAGVDYLDAGHPTTPAADVALTGVAPLADVGTLTITVTS